MRRSSPTKRRLSFESLESRLALATFYVSNAGSDSQAGSAVAPWQTLQKAADSVHAGDRVIVRPGNYVGFDLRTDGTASGPIVFHAESGAAITSRNGVTPDGVNLEGADYVTIEGFTINGMPRAGIRSVTNHHVSIRGNALDNNWVIERADLGFEFMMNALRLSDGVELSLFQQRTGLSLQAIHKGLAAATQKGLITQDLKRIKPTALGQRYLNDLLALFLD